MFHHSRMNLMLSAVALGVMLGMAVPALSATDVSLRIDFGRTPRWESVRGTGVYVVRQSDRSDYDVFRYGRRYYAYNHDNGRWYVSRRYNRRFVMISNREVPRELRRIPRDRWNHYPVAWEDRGYQGRGSSTFQVTFGQQPRWSWVRGTRVQVIPYSERPDYDVFRIDGIYYVYSNGFWYSSRRESGQFTRIDVQDVPDELYRVPRDQWRSYPQRDRDYGDRDYRGSSAGPSGYFEVTFGSPPRWYPISGTRVAVIPYSERPDYDVFRVDGTYYVYSDGEWYSSYRESGRFTQIDENDVPDELSRVPRDQWRNYPPAWGRRNREYDWQRGN